jgi:hypothetical protein
VVSCRASKPAAGPGLVSSDPRDEQPEPAPLVAGTVRCQFAGGWAAFVPIELYREDGDLLKPLIGLGQGHDWFGADDEPLRAYAARSCDAGGVTFELPAGSYELLVGRTRTYDDRAAYLDKGHVTDATLPGQWTIDEGMLTVTFDQELVP